MILSREDLIREWKSNRLAFKPDITEGQIGLTSIDLRLGKHVTILIGNPGITI